MLVTLTQTVFPRPMNGGLGLLKDPAAYRMRPFWDV